MGQTCTTETCCGNDGKEGEIRGDMSAMNGIQDSQLTSSRIRPLEMNESQRQRLIELGASQSQTQMAILLRRVVMI